MRLKDDSASPLLRLPIVRAYDRFASRRFPFARKTGLHFAALIFAPLAALGVAGALQVLAFPLALGAYAVWLYRLRKTRERFKYGAPRSPWRRLVPVAVVWGGAFAAAAWVTAAQEGYGRAEEPFAFFLILFAPFAALFGYAGLYMTFREIIGGLGLLCGVGAAEAGFTYLYLHDHKGPESFLAFGMVFSLASFVWLLEFRRRLSARTIGALGLSPAGLRRVSFAAYLHAGKGVVFLILYLLLRTGAFRGVIHAAGQFGVEALYAALSAAVAFALLALFPLWRWLLTQFALMPEKEEPAV